MGDLVKTIELDRSTVSRHAGELERRGLVTRSASPNDARATLLTVTRPGRAAADRVDEVWHRLLADAVREWTPEQRVRFTVDLRLLLGMVRTAVGMGADPGQLRHVSLAPGSLSLGELANTMGL